MALTLGTELAAAQDSASRHPLVEIKSFPALEDIPYDGRYFTGDVSVDEFQPFIINHSSGVSILVYVTTSRLMLAYTDASGNQFNIVELPEETGCSGVSCCEMPDGNIGITYTVGTYALKYRIVTQYGVNVSTGQIATWAANLTTSHTWVVRDAASGTYTLCYAKFNGTYWDIYKRTSSDFTTWSAESAITPSGLNRANRIFSPSICVMDNGDWWLWCDHVTFISADGIEVSNLFYSISTNKGATWGAATALTSNSDIAQTYKHPIAIRKSATDLFLAYTKEQALLKLGAYSQIVSLDINTATDKAYITTNSVEIKEINLSDWAVTRTWNSGTVPAISPGITTVERMRTCPFTGSARYHLCGNHRFISVLDSETNAIKHYYFASDEAHQVTHNMAYVNADLSGGIIPGEILGAYVDESSSRLYLVFGFLQVGWIDLTAPGPTYTFTVIAKATNDWPLDWRDSSNVFYVNTADDMIFYGGLAYRDEDQGVVTVWSLSTGALFKTYYTADNSSFPLSGPNAAFYSEAGFAYLGFRYNSLYGEVDKRGLCRINLFTDEVTYFRPTYSNADDYSFQHIAKGEGNTLVLTSSTDGVVLFDTVEHSWRLYNQAQIPQLPSNQFSLSVFDATRSYIISVAQAAGGYFLCSLPLQGVIKNSCYYTAALSGGAWAFTSHGSLVQGFSDYDATLAVSPVNPSMTMCFWESKRSTGVLSLKWDVDSPFYDLSPHLLLEKEITIERGIDGAPNKLSFACSHGHLFDPHNKSSLLCSILKKGRKLVARWGELVDGVEHWVTAGTFYVTDGKVSYERGIYTDIKIDAEDIRCLWQNKHVYATDYYNENYPEEVLTDIIGKNTSLVSGDISLPQMDNRIILEHQWLDTDLLSILDQIADRFGYVVKITADNKFSVSKISKSAAAAHAYPDSSTVVSFEPDDKYSDFTNRVTVQGQSKDYLTVTYPEERVGSLNGTVGWWGYNKNFNIYYSDDKSRTCINPRLEVLETATSIGFALAGNITESISFEDPQDHYCTVNVQAPDLTPILLGLVGAYIGTIYLPDAVVSYGGGKTIRIGSAAMGLEAMAIMNILASIGNYQYEIWAQPVGRVRRSVQGVADDLLHQGDMAMVIEKKLEDPLCYSPADCSIVAQYELMVVQLQRNRIKLTKIAHLQDEEGDTIQIRHPYSGTLLTVLIVKLERRFKKAELAGGDGYFLDSIEGWVIS